MHNTHLLIVEAKSGQEALNEAESQLVGWGSKCLKL